MRLILAAVSLVALSACAGGLSKEECLTADWKAIGYEDGARGAHASAVGSHRQACAKKAGVTPNMAAYLEGREIGLAQYCTPSNGFRVGASGAAYNGVCFESGEAAFKAQYWNGAHLYKLRSVVRSAENALRAAHQDIDALTYDMETAEAALIAADTTIEERILLVADLKRMADERAALENAIPDLIFVRDEAVADLEDYEWQLAAADDPRSTLARTASASLR